MLVSFYVNRSSRKGILCKKGRFDACICLFLRRLSEDTEDTEDAEGTEDLYAWGGVMGEIVRMSEGVASDKALG